MGTCCSKIDRLKDFSASFNGSLHPSLQKWQAAAEGSCHFCQVSGFAGHLQCCACTLCKSLAANRYGDKEFIDRRGYCETMCCLCAADACNAQLYHGASHVSDSRLDGVEDENENENVTHYEIVQRGYIIEHTLGSHGLSVGKKAIEQGDLDLVHGQQPTKSCSFDTVFLPTDHSHDAAAEHKDEMHHSETVSSSNKKRSQGYLLDTENSSAPMENLRRLSNIDDSDGIKLEVRYKHMLPHDTHPSILSYASHHDVNMLKRSRPQDGPLLSGDLNTDSSIQQCKSLGTTGLDKEEDLLKHSVHSLDCKDELDNDDAFHDIAVGININSFNPETHPMLDASEPGFNLDVSQGRDPLRDDRQSQKLSERTHIPDCVRFMDSDSIGVNRSIYVMSQENMQFIAEKEREWEERVNGMAMEVEDKIISKMQALSVVSTGDAILFSGADSDELHLIPSITIQPEKSPLSSPKQNLSPPRRIASLERCDEQAGGDKKSPLSIVNILLENDELDEDDLFSLLIDSCTKSSASSSPLSSTTETSNAWSSPLSSSSSSALSSTSSLSSTSVLQLPPTSTTYSLTLPHSLSLPPSCKMSPHTSFEFTVKSCGSTPSTPVFSPIRSRTKRNIAHLKPSALTSEEIAEIWGVFEQRQAFVSQQCMQK